MRIIRGEPESGKPSRTICTGCGKSAFEAGIAVPDDAVEHGVSVGRDGRASEVTVVDPADAEPLCEACVTMLLKGRPNYSHV